MEKDKYPVSLLINFMIVSTFITFISLYGFTTTTKNQDNAQAEILKPAEKGIFKIVWGNLGAKLVEAKVIDVEKFQNLYQARGIPKEEYETLLLGNNQNELTITKENAGYMLNLFWAFGLANKNEILENGEMSDPRYGGAQNFASTGGWTLGHGDAMEHYSMHRLINLTPKQQQLVEKTSQKIFRPCCKNSTHFPDCNHGMAMLGFLEIMASQGATESEMYEAGAVLNAYWFPELENKAPSGCAV